MEMVSRRRMTSQRKMTSVMHDRNKQNQKRGVYTTGLGVWQCFVVVFPVVRWEHRWLGVGVIYPCKYCCGVVFGVIYGSVLSNNRI